MNMNDTILFEQARSITELLPAVMRGLFTVDGDPAAELPLSQLRVCRMLLSCGPRPMSALSRELGVSLSAITQIADRLERARLVTRVAEENDRRIRCLQLTPHGEQIMRQREDVRIHRVLTVLEHLTPEMRQKMQGSLETLLEACVALKNEEAIA